MAAAAEQIVGTVSLIGEKGGFQILERPGTYWRVSDYATPKPSMPSVGQRVRLSLDGRAFVTAITVVDATTPGADVIPAPPASSPPSSSPATTTGPSRETTITRLAVLKCAATYAASRPDMKTADLVKLAECLERWALR